MLWECSANHQWRAAWNNVKNQGQWCPKCSKVAKPDILECHEFVKATYNGKCLETTYINSHHKMLWECKEKHQWRTQWNSIKNDGNWCPTCDGQTKPDILECHEFVKATYNGKCLETVYINNHTKMSWECKYGHHWKARWGHIKNNHWCPECSTFKTEYKCKELLEQRLGFILKKSRFYIGNKRYEWDGYNEEHKVAFEYQGIQHYNYPNHWHKTELEHLTAKQRDLDKITYAKEHDIKLIIIPYTEETNLEKYIGDIYINET